MITSYVFHISLYLPAFFLLPFLVCFSMSSSRLLAETLRKLICHLWIEADKELTSISCFPGDWVVSLSFRQSFSCLLHCTLHFKHTAWLLFTSIPSIHWLTLLPLLPLMRAPFFQEMNSLFSSHSGHIVILLTSWPSSYHALLALKTSKHHTDLSVTLHSH